MLSSWLSYRLWRRQLAFWAGGLALGVVAVGLAQAADYAQDGFSRILQRWWWGPFLLAPLGLAAAWLTVGWFQGSQGSGIPGGLFAPSLSAGAGIGSAIAPMMPMVPATTVILLGMVGYFSGVVQSPITAFVIVMEMTNDHQMMIPLMATSVIGYGASRIVCHRPIYHAIALTMIRREHDEERAEMHEHGARVQKA